jgi:hypothetical protein
MDSAIEKNKSDLYTAKIEPFSPENQFYDGNNGLILFITPQDGG